MPAMKVGSRYFPYSQILLQTVVHFRPWDRWRRPDPGAWCMVVHGDWGFGRLGRQVRGEESPRHIRCWR